jgi:hypothetical protein
VTEKTETGSLTNNAGASTERSCPKCKGSGVFFTINFFNRRLSIPCDQCGAGNRVWSRLQELIDDVDSTERMWLDDGPLQAKRHIYGR